MSEPHFHKPDEDCFEDGSCPPLTDEERAKALAEWEEVPLPLEILNPDGEGEAVYLPENPDVDAMNGERLRLQAENMELINGIARAEATGVGVNPPLLFTQLKLRLDMLTDVVLGGGPGRMAYELAYEEQLHAYLEELSVRVSRAQLVRP